MKIAYFVSHPIQYQTPLLRRIAQERDIDLTVFFSSDHSVRGYADEGFGGVQVRWDVPLLDGYSHEFLPGFGSKGEAGIFHPISHGMFSRLRRGRFDAVWSHGYHTVNALHAIVAAKLLQIPVLLRAESTLDDRPRNRGKTAARKLFFKLLRQAICAVMPIGKKNAEYWQATLGDTVPMFPMPYAVDNEYFRSRAAIAAAKREHLRQDLDLKPGRPVFLFASKLQHRKRCIDLIEAFIRLDSTCKTDPSAYLLVAGDGEERTTVEQCIRASHASSIRMLGFQNQSDLPRLFDLCDVFVLPSIYEPWGLIVNEVMNAARAVVVSDQVGCAPDLIRDGVNGFVFPAKNIDALVATLRRFLHDPFLAGTMGKAAAETITAYSFEQDVRGLREALAFVHPEFRP